MIVKQENLGRSEIAGILWGWSRRVVLLQRLGSPREAHETPRKARRESGLPPLGVAFTYLRWAPRVGRDTLAPRRISWTPPVSALDSPGSLEEDHVEPPGAAETHRE